MLARDRCDECLGAIAASHPQHVGAACDCILGELAQVVTWAQHDGLDVALPAQVDQPEAFGLPATGPEVHQQHRMTRTWRTLECAGLRPDSSVARGADRHRGQSEPDGEHDKALAGDHHHDEHE